MGAIHLIVSEKLSFNNVRQCSLAVGRYLTHINESKIKNAVPCSVPAQPKGTSRGKFCSCTAKFLINLVCAIVLLTDLPTTEAASASARLSVTARVTRGCRILTNPMDFIRSNSRASQGMTGLAPSTMVKINCDMDSDDTGTMAITTETNKAGKPIIEVFSGGTLRKQLNKPDRIIHGSTHSDSKIIHWGLFPIDAHLVISIPDQDRTGVSTLTDPGEQTLRVVIDF